MPDPLLYFQAFVAAAIASALVVVACLGLRRSPTAAWVDAACGIAIAIGLAVGLSVESLSWALPPVSALDRLLIIVIPAALLIEWIAGVPRGAHRIAWLLRISLVVMTPRVLLHQSVYLTDPDEWTVREAAIIFGVCWALLSSCWGLLVKLVDRSPGISIPLSLCLAIQCAGATVMMAGYLKGGEAALAITATLLGTAVAVSAVTRGGVGRARGGAGGRASGGASVLPAVLIGFGVIGLFGVLFIGHFFGRLSGGRAVAIGLAPLLCWATELSPLKHQRPGIVGTIRLGLVAIPLIVTLVLAKRDFDRDLAPLVVTVSAED